MPKQAAQRLRAVIIARKSRVGGLVQHECDVREALLPRAFQGIDPLR